MSALTFFLLTGDERLVLRPSARVIADETAIVEEPAAVEADDEPVADGAEPIAEEEPRADRDGIGRFAPGNPGGPGRPKGMLNKTTIEAQKRLAEAGGSKVIAQALKLAAQGEPAVVTALLKHVLPKQRTMLTPFALPAGELTESNLRAAATDVLRQLAEGEVTGGEAREALAAIEAARTIVLADDLRRRVEAMTTAPTEEKIETKTGAKVTSAADDAILRAWTKKAEPAAETEEPTKSTEEGEQ